MDQVPGVWVWRVDGRADNSIEAVMKSDCIVSSGATGGSRQVFHLEWLSEPAWSGWFRPLDVSGFALCDFGLWRLACG